MRSVYLDHAAATYLDPRVREEMLTYLNEDNQFGNPSALYNIGRKAKEAIDDARSRVAAVFGCRPTEIVFTASGTESDNLAVLGVARAYEDFGKHVICSAIEHPAVLGAVDHLKTQGWETTVFSVNEFGFVTPSDIKDALTEKTTVVSIIYANNEIGTILPIRDYAKVIRDWKKVHDRGPLDPPFFHTDACQAAGYLDLTVAKLGVDLMTINGSKIYGPKGTGALYVKRGVKVQPLIFGGGQEMGLRSGTENVVGIVGFAKALEVARDEQEAETKRLTPMRDDLIQEMKKIIPKVVLNGDPINRLPNNVNVSILDVEGEALLLYLDAVGISAATGSACDSRSLDPSHVILAIGKPYEFAHSSIRFSLGRKTTKKDIDYLLEKLPGIVEMLRKISPVHISEDGETVTGSKTAFVTDGRPHWEK